MFDVKQWKAQQRYRIDYGMVSLMLHAAKTNMNNFIVPLALRDRLTDEAMAQFGVFRFNDEQRRTASVSEVSKVSVKKVVEALRTAA